MFGAELEDSPTMIEMLVVTTVGRWRELQQAESNPEPLQTHLMPSQVNPGMSPLRPPAASVSSPLSSSSCWMMPQS